MYSKEQILAQLSIIPECNANAIKDITLTSDKIIIVFDADRVDLNKKESIAVFCTDTLTNTYQDTKIQVIFSQESRKTTTRNRDVIANVKNVILITSGKGGVGKSTVASILAVALAKRSLKVGLLDADMYGPSIPLLFDVKQKPEISQDNQMLPIKKWGVNLMSIGFLVESAQAIIWRGPMLTKALYKMTHEVDWKYHDSEGLDVLLVDTPPGTGDIHLNLATKYAIDGVLCVSTSQILALQDTIRSIQMFKELDIPILGMVQNMSYIQTLLGKKYIFEKNGVASYCKESGLELLGNIPLDPKLAHNLESGINAYSVHPVFNDIKLKIEAFIRRK